jgi:hypothetical protein
MLNILTEHDFEDTFRKLAEELETAYAWKGTTWKMVLTSRPKATFDQIETSVLEIVDNCSVFSICLS